METVVRDESVKLDKLYSVFDVVPFKDVLLTVVATLVEVATLISIVCGAVVNNSSKDKEMTFYEFPI